MEINGVRLDIHAAQEINGEINGVKINGVRLDIHATQEQIENLIPPYGPPSPLQPSRPATARIIVESDPTIYSTNNSRV